MSKLIEICTPFEPNAKVRKYIPDNHEPWMYAQGGKVLVKVIAENQDVAVTTDVIDEETIPDDDPGKLQGTEENSTPIPVPRRVVR